MKRFGMKGRAIPTSLPLLLLWMCCSLAAATRGIHSGKDAGCEVLTDKISDTVFVLNTHTLQSANGDVQRILDCLPEGSKVLIDMEDVPLSEDLVIRKPMAIHSKRNDVKTTISGGVIKVRADNTEVKGLMIEEYSLNSTEGYIDIESAEGVVIEDVECSGCSNSNGPSCISARWSSVTITKFGGKNNTGSEGGALGFANSTIVIRESVFENNTASEHGGALYMDTCDLEMENTVLTGNSAANNGGGVYVEGDSWTSKPAFVRNCSFIWNHADDRGGGLFYSSSQISSSTISIVDADVRDNSATYYGGGVLIDMSYLTNPTVKVQSSRFINNSATFGGGGMEILMRESTNSMAQVINSNIANNSAAYGGGVYIDARDSNNYTTDVIRTQITNNTASDLGGGVLFFTGESASIFQIINSNIVSNTASDGGGVCVYGRSCDSCATDIIGTQITNNTARISGGGALINYYGAINTHADIVKSSIDDNTARVGSAMYFMAIRTDATEVKLLLSSFVNAPDGGLYFDTDSATNFNKTVFECTIADSSDPQASADVFVKNPGTYLTNIF